MSVLNNGPGVVAAGGSPVLIYVVSLPFLVRIALIVISVSSVSLESIAAQFKAQYSVDLL